MTAEWTTLRQVLEDNPGACWTFDPEWLIADDESFRSETILENNDRYFFLKLDRTVKVIGGDVYFPSRRDPESIHPYAFMKREKESVR